MRTQPMRLDRNVTWIWFAEASYDHKVAPTGARGVRVTLDRGAAGHRVRERASA